MGNSLIEQCTGDGSKIQGFNGDMSAVEVNHSPSRKEMEVAEPLPSRSEKVEQTYQLLLSERAVDYTLEGQKSTFRPIRLTIFDEGGVYIGWTKNDQPHGPGQLYFDSQKYLQGIFKEGEVDCEDALFIQPTGSYYRGGFRKSRQSGFGTLRKGEDSIVGRFENGLAEGKGEKLFGDGRIYRGNFEKGKMEGKGRLTLPNGHQYCGYFREDAREGVGKLKTPQYEYFGPYKGDKKEGKATVLFSDGSKFEGWFQNDRIEGYGEWHRLNGTVEKGNYSLSLPS